jgi:uncharacterized protein YbbK (DUF523 family)
LAVFKIVFIAQLKNLHNITDTGKDLIRFHANGANYTLEISQIIGAQNAYFNIGSPSCDKEDVTGEMLKRIDIKVVRVQ